MPVKLVKVTLDQPVIDGVLHDDAGKFVTKTTLKVLNRSKVLCPVDTGLLRSSLSFSVKATTHRVTGEVYSKVKYASWVHDGRDYWLTIRPTTKKALAFNWKGRHWVLASVHQPPRKGRPYLRDALREVAALEGFQMTRSAKYGPPATG